jgi:ComEC/Rec2-related protein
MASSDSYSDLLPRRQPFIFLTGAFVAGILIDQWLVPPFWPTAIVLLALIGAGIKLHLSHRPAAAVIVILAGFLAGGVCLSSAVRRGARSDGLKRIMEGGLIIEGDPVQLFGVLDQPPEPLPDGVLLNVRAAQIEVSRRTLKASGSARLMMSLRDETARNEYDDLHLTYGSEVRILLRLETARSYSNPGSPDFNEFLERRGYQLKGTIKSPLLIQVLGRTSGNPLLRVLYGARLWLLAEIDKQFPARVAGTLKAMLAANRYFVAPETAERLRQSAAFHILVIAGFHIGIIAWVILGRPSTTRRSRLRVIAALIGLWAYAVAVGMEPPVVRATTMITIGIVGPIIFRRSASLNTVAISAFAMLAVDPSLVFDPGFQMSFAAVAGIVGLAVPFVDRLRQLGSWRPSASTPHPPSQTRLRTLAEILFWDERSFQTEVYRSDIKYGLDKARTAVLLSRWFVQPLIRYPVLLVITSVAIQLVTLPLMILYFNRVAPVGIIINIVAGLLAGIIMVGALFSIGAAPVSAWASAAFGKLVIAAHDLLVTAVVPFLSIPGASFRSPNYEGAGRILYLLYYMAIVMVAILLDRWRPVDVFLPASWLKGARLKGARLKGARKGSRETVEAAAGSVMAGRVNQQPFRRDAVRTGDAYQGAPSLPSSLKWLSSRIGWVNRSLAYRSQASRWQAYRSQAYRSLISAIVLALLVVTINRPFPAGATGKLSVYFLDVGQGDSALVVFPRGSTMLVDAGGEIHIGQPRGSSTYRDLAESQSDEDGLEKDIDDNSAGIGEVVVSRFLWSLGLRKLDYALATHAHEDHIGGFQEVLRNFRVGELLVGHSPRSDYEFNHLIRRAGQEHVRVAFLSQGDELTIDGVEVQVLWPPRGGENSSSGNDDSIVLYLKHRSVSFILAGDIEQETERQLCLANKEMHADLLKVPHHGSKTSSTDEFIDRVQPSYAVISVGKRSRFGHPSPAVVGRYRQRGIQLLQTGKDGMVTAQSDGSRLVIRTFLEPRN